MPLTARVQVTHSDFRVTPTVRRLKHPKIEVASDARTDPENDVYFFVVDNDRQSFERALAADHTVADAKRTSGFKGKQLYRITYDDSALLLSPAVTSVGGLTREATATADGWLFTLQVPDRDALSRICEYATGEDMTWELVTLRPESGASNGPYGLTDTQRETLLVALERGYFSEPREATLADLADALDISQTAAGGRLRRGLETLVRATVAGEP
ncbi:helix-turn-helix domain-containing protein [Halobacteriales archaeon QS_1_68_17]|nr:MAG: helix-turn-helix domain-containing protein [Halobacteriales archaeon QS_1_68_17]